MEDTDQLGWKDQQLIGIREYFWVQGFKGKRVLSDNTMRPLEWVGGWNRVEVIDVKEVK